MNTRTLTRATVATLASASLILAGCSDSTKESVDDATSAVTSAAAEVGEDVKEKVADAVTEVALHLEDGYVKAIPENSGMTAVFGVLENRTDRDITLVGFTTSLDDADYEIHEVVDGTMREKDGGIKIKAGGKHILEPGADHLMILNHDRAIEAGSTINVILELSDGTKVTLKDVPVRAIAAGEEDYASHGDHGMKHGDDS
ncbi:copper chaperone PCu(A)C [Corynebacterium sp. CCM 9203]|uniref:copper chaperone PCu(A)C n=1 Tax=Corynebacterium sp. CCM 9203 TaxID=3057615 RepID=UPI00352553AE